MTETTMNVQPGPMEFLAAFSVVLVVGVATGFALCWRRKHHLRSR